ncbi:unnamed protein product [Thelazia callipaeda]|uniref:Tudor domain-containing protein n=1 Tax=Thelazia callipaeda TaxID=103827 RepID=A0A0N5D687_THECL|nr:unnamed protein product [Thelazia callipaeda]
MTVSQAQNRALWMEEFVEENTYQQDYQRIVMNPNTLRVSCLNCNSESHKTTDCILPRGCVSCFENGEKLRKMVSLRLYCNTNCNTRYMISYDYPLKGTVLHINRKNNCLYVRPQNLDDECALLEAYLFDMKKTVLSPTPPTKINIAALSGGVYLIRRQGSNVLARAVCAHMFFNWRMSTHWQVRYFFMYLIDIGQTEFVDERFIYILPVELQLVPPLAMPLLLTNCRVGYESTNKCALDHFSPLYIGSTCIFALSSSYKGQVLSLSKDGYYPNFANSMYPPALLARVFSGASINEEIFCKWGLPDLNLLSHALHAPYYPSTFAYKKFSLDPQLPVTLAVRVTEKISPNQYWLHDASLCSFINKQMVLPSNGLWPYVEVDRSLACIAYIQRPVRKRLHYYRAVASNFDDQKSRCSVFLIDYGQTLNCDVHNLFDLSDQPAVVLHTFAAAFQCIVNQAHTLETGIHIAKLAVDEKYIIQLIGKEDENTYTAIIDMYIQPHFQCANRFSDLDSNSSLIRSIDNGQLTELPTCCDEKSSFNYHLEEISTAVELSDGCAESTDVSNDNADNYNNDNSDNNNTTTITTTTTTATTTAITITTTNNNNNNNDNNHDSDNNSTDNNSNDNNNNDNNKTFERKIISSLVFNREIGNGLKSLDVKVNVKLAQVSNRLDDLFNAFHRLQVTEMMNKNKNMNLTLSFFAFILLKCKCVLVLMLGGAGVESKFEQKYCTNEVTQVTAKQESRNQNQASPPPAYDGKDIIFYNTQYQPSLIRQNPWCRYQPVMYPQHYQRHHQYRYQHQYQHQHYHQHQQPHVILSNGRCYIHGYENQNCEYANMQWQSNHIYSNQINQQGILRKTNLSKQRHAVDSNMQRNQSQQTRTFVPGCVICSQQQLIESQTSKLCCFCGAYMEKRIQHHATNSSYFPSIARRVCMPHPTQLHSVENHLPESSNSIYSSSFAHSNFNTHSNVDGQILSRCSSPTRLDICGTAILESMNTVGNKKKPFISKEPRTCNNSNNTYVKQTEGLEKPEKKSETFCKSTSSFKQQTILSIFLNILQSFLISKNKSESCWICGKSGHLTRYCQSTPPDLWQLPQDTQKATINKPRDEKGRVLYTSDESSDDELIYESESEETMTQVFKHLKVLAFPGDQKQSSILRKMLLVAHFNPIAIEFGHKYAVTRSDDDTDFLLWPLFFVQIHSKECHKILDTYLDSLVVKTPLTLQEMAIGKLCVAYCERFDAKFRAVITAIRANLVEVFYVDYGNYEWVLYTSLWSISDQDQTIMKQPGMAIPCILQAYDEVAEQKQEEVSKMKEAVSCRQCGFWLQFYKQRVDGVYVVNVVDEEDSKNLQQ